MSARKDWSHWLSGINIALTVLGISMLVVGIGIDRSKPSAFPALPFQDYLVAMLLWSYIVATPICGGLAIALDSVRKGWVRVNYLLLLIWLAFMVWTGTMTL
ncbi:hypothetical protein sS8_0849 [Methylocaldum marinum]|uniref:Uncharacterized protein n=1 Tax=Methylocaldum marinum TaxID=1432792 RepID=A0A250KMM6_9GAMM|nr:hypothetical protein sS8_0849 [Methylocaldum marinum]